MTYYCLILREGTVKGVLSRGIHRRQKPLEYPWLPMEAWWQVGLVLSRWMAASVRVSAEAGRQRSTPSSQPPLFVPCVGGAGGWQMSSSLSFAYAGSSGSERKYTGGLSPACIFPRYSTGLPPGESNQIPFLDALFCCLPDLKALILGIVQSGLGIYFHSHVHPEWRLV